MAFRYLRELLLNIIREIRGGGLDPNTVDALHFRLDWLHDLIARLVNLYGIDEQIVNLIRGARDCLICKSGYFWCFVTSHCLYWTTWTSKIFNSQRSIGFSDRQMLFCRRYCNFARCQCSDC